MDERDLLAKRFAELSEKSRRGYYLFSDFLGLNEQAVFEDIKRLIEKNGYSKFGGADGAERIMIRFGSEDEIGYAADFPISCIKIEPKSQKFADKLTHRDFLGALMNLGIERSTLGDIVIRENVGYLFCKNEIAEYIISSLTKVKHTDVRLSVTDSLPDGELYRTERRRVQAVGERLDALIAKVFSLSRDESLTYFKRKLVFADGRLIENNSYIPRTGEKISVRGLGRFIYIGFDSTTKKGKLNIEVDLYI